MTGNAPPIDLPDALAVSDLTSLLDMDADAWSRVNRDHDRRRDIAHRAQRLADSALRDDQPDAVRTLHDLLHLIYDHEFAAADPSTTECETQPVLRSIAAVLEEAMLQREYEQIDQDSALDGMPDEGPAYLHWLKDRINSHPAGRHPFYSDFLAERAQPTDFRYYLAQETNLDPRFDDILALLQIGVKPAEKMELAGNYWDEMGNGDPAKIHTMLFDRALETLSVDPSYVRANLMPESKVSGNLSACLALSRRHHFKAVGFFGATEYLVPRRFHAVCAGWDRLGLPSAGIAYHRLHIGVDAAHASGWFKNVVRPLVDDHPGIGREIAIGVLIRMHSSLRYLDSLSSRLDREA